jgi:mycofactocin biosynthetic radical S-adenosylmethionine protein MftC
MGADGSLRDRFELGLDAPICLTWEITWACNLACVHCLSSSGRRDPRELTTTEAAGLIDDLAEMQVFYVNVGGGEPTIRGDFFELLEHAVHQKIGVKFSTNGSRINASRASRLASMDYVDVQVSIDGATAAVNDAIRGAGSFVVAERAMRALADAGLEEFKVSVVVTSDNVGQLDEFQAIASRYGAQLRLTRLRPSGRAVDQWDRLRPTAAQNRELHAWLLDHPRTLTGDSFFHLSALGDALDGLNLCGAGRVVCLVDPIGDVYACPFTIHDEFLAGSVRSPGGFASVWREAPLFAGLRSPGNPGACASCGSWDACRGGCMAAKFFTGMPLEGPDPDCVHGRGASSSPAAAPSPVTLRPRASRDHSAVPVAVS